MIALFFDTETTGFKREDFTPEIVQIAAILQDTETRREFAEMKFIVTPYGVIPDQVAEIHGITTELARSMGMDQYKAEQLLKGFFERSDVTVAHNIEFDMQMLELNWLDAYREALLNKQYCTMQEATPIMKLPKNGGNHYHDSKYPDFKAPRLAEAYEYFVGGTFANAHDAMADTRACRDIYFAIQDRQS